MSWSCSSRPGWPNRGLGRLCSHWTGDELDGRERRRAPGAVLKYTEDMERVTSEAGRTTGLRPEAPFGCGHATLRCGAGGAPRSAEEVFEPRRCAADARRCAGPRGAGHPRGGGGTARVWWGCAGACGGRRHEPVPGAGLSGVRAARRLCTPTKRPMLADLLPHRPSSGQPDGVARSAREGVLQPQQCSVMRPASRGEVDFASGPVPGCGGDSDQSVLA